MGRHCGRDRRPGLEFSFENLEGWDYSVIEEDEDLIDFNCIAWAAGDRERWWWPGAYWPSTCPQEESVEAFVDAYASCGYSVCDDDLLEQGFDKIALFTNSQGKPTHAARQLDALCWSSKLGRDEILCHPLRAIEGNLYGQATVFLRRPSPPTQEDPVRTLGCPGGSQT